MRVRTPAGEVYVRIFEETSPQDRVEMRFGSGAHAEEAKVRFGESRGCSPDRTSGMPRSLGSTVDWWLREAPGEAIRECKVKTLVITVGPTGAEVREWHRRVDERMSVRMDHDG